MVDAGSGGCDFLQYDISLSRSATTLLYKMRIRVSQPWVLHVTVVTFANFANMSKGLLRFASTLGRGSVTI